MPNENDNKLVTLADLSEAYTALYNRDVMTSADKTKLDGIAAGAQVNSNSITGIKGNAENSYRSTGNINITASNIGAISNDTDDTKTANLTILNDDESYIKIKNTFDDPDTGKTAEIYLKAGIRNHGLDSPGYLDDSRVWHDDHKWMVYRNSSGDVILNGNATNDANGSNIAATYLPKYLSSGISDNFDSPSQSIIQLMDTSSGTNPSSVTDGNQWLLLTDILDNNKYSGQLAIGFAGLAWRGKTNTTTWSNWKGIPLGDGTGASGNWSINAATATKATGIIDAGNNSKTLTIRYYGDGVSPTSWMPMYDNSGNLVPVSVSDFKNQSMGIVTIIKHINITGANEISISFTSSDFPTTKKIAGVSSIRSSDSYMIPYISSSGSLDTFISRVYDREIKIINLRGNWDCDLYITLILTNAT